MLLRFDPFRDVDRLTNEILGTHRVPQVMPMDCYRSGDTFYLHFDLPGIDADSLRVTAEDNTLTVQAQRRSTAPDNAAYLVAERQAGAYSRQLVLGDGLDTDSINADYHDGVLTLTIPVAERAKPRKIEVTRSADSGAGQRRSISGEMSDSNGGRQAVGAGR
jgi:HSP20 family protein